MLQSNKIIRCVTLFFLPYIFLYSVYVQLNGEVSPGGGFQAGVIFSSALIAYDLICSENKLTKCFSVDSLIFIAGIGVVIYIFVGLISLLFDNNFLNYYSFKYFTNDKFTAQYWGIFIVEIGIGLDVAAVMYLIYSSFSSDKL